MTLVFRARACAVALLVGAFFSAPVARAEGVRRFALVAGNDRGGADTRPLLYARNDARKVLDILLRLGGVQPADAILLLDEDAASFLAALARLEERARRARDQGEKTAAIIYYSGHAKNGSLRLGTSELPLPNLKARLAAAPFDVRIGIFDSCRSGALTRIKGARHAPAFEIDTRAGRDARGTVILTSSAADEDSQESDQIGGSYFSHHLASGLLGAADKSGDGRVTLSEAYAHAYDRTVADTAESAAGAQHPTFSYDLAGNGDLVLTDLIARREGLLIPAHAPASTYFLVDRRGYVSAEVVKSAGVARRIALPPGRYSVKRRLPAGLRIGEIDIPPGQPVALEESSLRDVPFSDDPVKGSARGASLMTSSWSIGAGGGYQSVFAAPSQGLFPAAGLATVDVSLRDFFRRDWVWGIDVSGGGTRSQVALPTVVVPFRFNQVSLASSLVSEWPGTDTGQRRRWVVPFLGARLALLLMSRKFDEQALPDQFFATLSPGLVVGTRFPIGERWGLVLRGRLHYLLYNIDQKNSSLGYWEAAGFAQYDLGGSP